MLKYQVIKSVKDMVITKTAERAMYSGGKITLHNSMLFDKKECLIILRNIFQLP